MTGEDRGQAYTLEGLVSALLIASAVLFGLQAVDVAPYVDDTGDENLENLRTQVEDTLALAAEDGTLQQAVTCVVDDTGQVHWNVSLPPDENVTQLGHILNQTLDNNGYEYRVYFDHWDNDTSAVNSTLVYPDVELPSTGETVTARQRVTLWETSQWHSVENSTGGYRCEPQGTIEDRYTNGEPFYLNDSVVSGPGDPEVFTIVDVRVVAW